MIRASSNDSGEQQPRCQRLPVGEPVQHSTRHLDISAGIQERIEDVDVVTAGCPMQRGFPVRAVQSGVGIRSRLDKQSHGYYPVRKMARPVGGHVQESASCPALVVTSQPRTDQTGMPGQQKTQRIYITLP